MGGSIFYSGAEHLGLYLGQYDDRLFIESTASTVDVTTHGGNDTVHIGSIGARTMVESGDGDDTIRVNYDENGFQT